MPQINLFEDNAIPASSIYSCQKEPLDKNKLMRKN